ncbi:hypothetical protein GBAR_LOCUS11587 [Geodia barretti]|uniref:Uncharacterized protein n=1 Tax=Geodia barretti TaxID=519541 RepID=A0AA35RZ53_GEOBA|nr:hypothetical protein GBAR_LOCUS11587 [Geodia barretti]
MPHKIMTHGHLLAKTHSPWTTMGWFPVFLWNLETSSMTETMAFTSPHHW